MCLGTHLQNISSMLEHTGTTANLARGA